MAAATATLTVNAYPNGVDNTQRRSVIYGKCTLTVGGDYVTNGIPLNWGDLLSASGGQFLGNWSTLDQPQPQWAEFRSAGNAAGTTVPGYVYIYDTTNNTLRIASGTAELVNTDVVTADEIVFRAEFNRGI